MSIIRLALASARYFWRTNLAIALGVAAAVAVLVGALLVGDSMRGSLRDIAIDRIGKIDDVLTCDHFFSEELAREFQPISGERFELAVPAVLFPATTVEYQSGDQVRRSVDVNLFAVPDDFWRLQSGPTWMLADNQVLINAQLASELDLGQAEKQQPKITIRVATRQQLSSDSALGKKEGLVQSLPDVDVAGVLPNRELGRFGLRPTQMVPNNLFVSLSWFQNALGPELFKGKPNLRQANFAFYKRAQGSSNPHPPSNAIDTHIGAGPFQLADLGLRLSRVAKKFQPSGQSEPATAFEYLSLSSDGLVLSDDAAKLIREQIPQARPVFTYLANRMQVIRDGQPLDEAIPFSMLSGLTASDAQKLEAIGGEPIESIAENSIVLNEWAADNLSAKVGDTVRVAYFEPEARGGKEIEHSVDFTLQQIAKLTRPVEPYLRRGGQVLEAKFTDKPTWANDPDLTPLVPGLTDAESIEAWSLPFETPGIRRADDEYWGLYRTTPKAFVSLQQAQSLWSSRFGQVTGFRIPIDSALSSSENEIAQRLAVHAKVFGFNLIPARENGLNAASGSTPFDYLFLALSMFVMLSALILITLLIRLTMQQRADQLGTLSAIGFGFGRLSRLWLLEMAVVCASGAIAGMILGLGYAQLMLWGLRTWWVGAIRTPFVRMHVSPTSLVLGTVAGLAIGMLTIMWTLWRIRRVPSIELMLGKLESTRDRGARRVGWSRWMGVVFALGAVLLAVAAAGERGESQAGLFFGGGFCALAALLCGVWTWLKSSGGDRSLELTFGRLALQNLKRNAWRSLLTIGLVAVASFMIVAISAFRVAPDESGTGGFDFVATSNQPLFADLNSVEGQRKLLLQSEKFSSQARILSFRLKSGDDASCNNPFQVAQPRVIGVPADSLTALDSSLAKFAWGGVDSKFREHPWQVLGQSSRPGEPIPAVIDRNTAWYSLKIYSIGKTFAVHYDSGERVTFRLAGLLNNTVLQGSIIVSESDFSRAFPAEVGYRYFLVSAPRDQRQAVIGQLENDLADQGFDGRDSRELLSELLAVQNTYLSTFQALGALGLLLGTFGLAAAQLRSVLERRRELALFRAVGFRDAKLVRLVFWENFVVLAAGLGVGIVAAVVAVLPHFVFGNASVPWLALTVVFAAIMTAGWLTVVWTSRRVLKTPLLSALREA